MLFWAVAWYVGTNISLPVSALPDRRVLYVGLFVVSAVLFGGAMYTAARLTPPGPGVSQDEWWRANLGRAIGIWALVEAPAIARHRGIPAHPRLSDPDRPVHRAAAVRELSPEPPGRGVDAGHHAAAGGNRDRGSVGRRGIPGGHLARVRLSRFGSRPPQSDRHTGEHRRGRSARSMRRSAGCATRGKPVIGIAADLLRRLAPDLVITQDLCEVCAVADGEVHRLTAAHASGPSGAFARGPRPPGDLG